ncbi:hypothetical protein [Tamlana sp. I1]|uniref:hypothetical protein n=1 Tax=Tamlana sp. I1 TaxID=2762061 RepID=UPI001E50160B|nr:hypothetical protein [Tamlana sp. I1]
MPLSIEVLDGYNKTVFNKRKEKNEALLEESAKYAHDNNLIYFVTVFDNETPISHIETNKGFFRVHFLDNLKRTYMSYAFNGFDDSSKWQKEIPENKLFLSTVNIWEFKDDNEKAYKTVSYVFTIDGQLTIIERNTQTNEQIEKQSKSKVDISSNWEDYPKFGYYEGLIEKERGITPAL